MNVNEELIEVRLGTSSKWIRTLYTQCTQDYKINLQLKYTSHGTLGEDFRIIESPGVFYRNKAKETETKEAIGIDRIVIYRKVLDRILTNQNHVSIISLLFAGFLGSICFCKSINSAPLLANNRRKFITERSENPLTAKSA